MESTATIYGSERCKNCTMAKEYLKQRGIEFNFHDVTKDKEKFKEMKEISGGARSIPVIVACHSVIIGFEKEVLDKALQCLN